MKKQTNTLPRMQNIIAKNVKKNEINDIAHLFQGQRTNVHRKEETALLFRDNEPIAVGKFS